MYEGMEYRIRPVSHVTTGCSAAAFKENSSATIEKMYFIVNLLLNLRGASPT